MSIAIFLLLLNLNKSLIKFEIFIYSLLTKISKKKVIQQSVRYSVTFLWIQVRFICVVSNLVLNYDELLCELLNLFFIYRW